MDQSLLSNRIRQDEGEKAFVYQDSLGYWTIGNGFLIDARKGGKLYPNEIAFILQNRINIAHQEASAYTWFDELDEVRQAAVVMIVYQLGEGTLNGFHDFLAAMDHHDYDTAFTAGMDSKWAKEDSPSRALRDLTILKTGVWQ